MSDEYTPTTADVFDAYGRSYDEVDFPNDEAYQEHLAGGGPGGEFGRWLAEHDRQVAAEAIRAGQAALVDWLIDIGYPFDFTFDAKPPVDVDDLARRWNERDGWDVSDEEAVAAIFEQTGPWALPEINSAAPHEYRRKEYNHEHY